MSPRTFKQDERGVNPFTEGREVLGNTLSSWTRTGAVLLACALLIAGCNPFAPDPKPGGEVEIPTRDTPEGLFKFFAYVYSDPQRDLTQYGDVLHSSYLFYFTLDDRTANPEIPEFWAKTTDVTGTGKMFEQAVSISMTMTPSRLLGTEACDPTVPEVMCRVYEADIDLSVEAPGETENTTFLVEGLANVAVTEDPLNPGLWVIYSIVDRTTELGGGAPPKPRLVEGAPSSASVENVSWGELRSLFPGL